MTGRLKHIVCKHLYKYRIVKYLYVIKHNSWYDVTDEPACTVDAKRFRANQNGGAAITQMFLFINL
jgi:hypothetical protein